jgi:uncharacterized integral membrane protein
MRRLSILVTLPITVLVLIFAVANRAPVTLSLWPLPWTAELPGYLVILGGVLVGFAAGALVAWLSGGRQRRAARRNAAEARRLTDELAALKRRQAPPAAPPATQVSLPRPAAVGELPHR